MVFSQGARKAAIRTASILFIAMLSHAATAQHFWIDPRAEARLSLTDNANLTQSDRVQDVVLNASTGLNVRLESARTRLAFDYALDYYYFISDGTTDIRHNMFTSVDSEVWEEHLTLNGRANWRQQYLDQRGSLSNNFANKTNNRRLMKNYTASAILKGGMVDYADWRVSYRLGLSQSPADNLDDDTLTANFSDTVSHEIKASVGSGQRFNNFEWDLFASSSTVTRSLDVNDYEYDKAGGQLTFKFNRFFSLFGTASYSRNSFQSAVLSEDGFGWTTGFRWNPGRKLDLRVEHGREGARKVWSATVQHFFSARIDLRGSYQDTITANSIVTNDTLQSFQFDQENGITDALGLPADESDPRFTYSDVDFRRRVAQGTVTWRHKRSELYVNTSFEWRTYDDDTGTGKSRGVSAGFKRKLTRKSTLSGSIGVRESRFENSTRLDSFITANIDWTKTVSRYYKVAIGYGHTERQSTEPGADLEENTLTFYLRGTF